MIMFLKELFDLARIYKSKISTSKKLILEQIHQWVLLNGLMEKNL